MTHRSRLAAVAAVSAAIASAADVESALIAALGPVLAETDAEADEVFLLAQPRREMVLAAHHGLYPEAFHQITRFSFAEGFPGIVAASGEPIVTHRLGQDRRYLRGRVKELGFQHYLCQPLKTAGKLVGCLNLASRHPFSPGGAEFCQVVSHPLALAVDRAYLTVLERLGRPLPPTDGPTLRVGEVLGRLAGICGAPGVVLFWGEGLMPVAHWGEGVSPPLGQGLVSCPPLIAGEVGGPCQHSQGCRLPAGGLSAVCLPIKGSYREGGVASLFFDAPPPSWVLSMLPLIGEQVGLVAGLAIAGPISPQDAVSQERQRLGRELHDGLAHSIGLVAQRGELLARLSQRDPQAALAEAAALRRSVQDSLEELKSVVLGLQPPILEHGLETALRRLSASVGRYYNVKVHFQAHDDTGKLPALWELPLYRIAQEAVSNAVRHGKAGRVGVVLSAEPPLLSLTVRDDGQGFNPAPVVGPGHRGLAHMSQRAQALNGSFHLQSSPGEGTTVTVTVPLPAPA